MEREILIDVDGVLLNWLDPFSEYMDKLGYKRVNHDQYGVAQAYCLSQDLAQSLCEKFNSSARAAFLEPIPGSARALSRLHSVHGYRFHVITSFSNDPYARKLRIHNLLRVFGEDLFSGFTFLGCGDRKLEVLRTFSGSGKIFIEDKPENAEDGASVGLRSFLLTQPWNECHFGIPRADSWDELLPVLETLVK